MNTRKPWFAPLAITLLVAAPVALAGKGRDHDDDFGPGGGFIAQAVEACAGKAAGAEVSLTGRDGVAMPAVCTERPAQLVAVPKAHLERMAQAKTACNGLAQGAAAVVSLPDGRNVAATCQLRHGELLAVPTERPRRPR